MTRPPASERPTDRVAADGFVAGSEALVFGFLVLLLGTLLVLNVWSAIDARFAAAGAAREAVRAAVQAPVGADLEAHAREAAITAYTAHGRAADHLAVRWVGDAAGPRQARCAELAFRVETVVEVVAIPRWATRPTYRVAAEHAERIEPFRSGLDATECPP